MKVTCQQCGAQYKVKEEKVPPTGMDLPCPKCKAVIHVTVPSAPAAPAVPVPQEEEIAPPPAMDFGDQFSESPDFSDVSIDDDDFGTVSKSEEEAKPAGLPDLPWGNNAAPASDEFTEISNLSSPPKGTAFDLPVEKEEKPAPQAGAGPSGGAPHMSMLMTPPPDIDFGNAFDDAPDVDIPAAPEVTGSDIPAMPGLESTNQDIPDPFGDLDFNSAASGSDIPSFEASETPAEASPAGFGDADSSMSVDFDFGGDDDVPPELPPAESSFDDLFATPSDNSPGDMGVPSFGSGTDDNIDPFAFGDIQPGGPSAGDTPPLTTEGAGGESGSFDFDFSAGEESSGGDLLDQIVELTAGEDGVSLFKVRRKSGRVFGPFPENTIVEMFKTGKLAREDEIASEGESWSPISSLPGISEMIGGAPASADFPAEAEDDIFAGEGRPGEGRLRKRGTAALPTMEARSAVKRSTRRRSPMLLFIILGVVILGVGGTEAYMRMMMESSLINVVIEDGGVSKYSYKALSPSRKKMYEKAEKAILSDVFSEAVKIEKKLDMELKQPEFKGRLALLGMDVTLKHYMLLSYGKSKTRENAITALLKDQDLQVGENIHSVMLALGMQEMQKGSPERARTFFQKALQHSVTKWDALAAHLIAWSYLSNKDYMQGQKQLEPLIQSKKGYPLTYQLMGKFAEAAGDKEKARAYYEVVIEKEPNHSDAVIAMQMLDIDDPEKQSAVEEKLQALLKTENAVLASSQSAQVHYILAQIYLKRNEPFKVTKELGEAIKADPFNASYYSALGDFLYKTHEYQKAEQEFQRCLKINEKQVSCYIGLAHCKLAKAEPEEALIILQDAARAVGKDAALAYSLGLTLEHQKLLSKALKYYEDAISLDPKNVKYYTKAAEIYLRSDNLVKASEFVQKAKSIEADSPYVHNFLGVMYVYKADLEMAIAEFNAALEINPTFIDSYVNVGNAYRDHNKFEESIESFNKALQLDDKHAPAYYGLGRTLMAQENFEGAVAQLELAVRYDANHKDYHFALGQAYYAQKRYADAAAALSREIEISFDYSPAYFLLGRVNFDAKKWDDAGTAFQQAVNLDKQNPMYHFWLGKLYNNTGRDKSAVEYFDAALSLKPDYAEAWLYKGLSLLNQKQFQKALQSLKKSIRHNDKMPASYISRAECYTYFKKYKEAEKDYLKAIKLDPKHVYPYYELGRLYQDMGKDKKALKYLNKAKKIAPDYSLVYWALGFGYKKLRRYREAIRSFETYLELTPNAVDADDIRQEIDFLKR